MSGHRPAVKVNEKPTIKTKQKHIPDLENSQRRDMSRWPRKIIIGLKVALNLQISIQDLESIIGYQNKTKGQEMNVNNVNFSVGKLYQPDSNQPVVSLRIMKYYHTLRSPDAERRSNFVFKSRKQAARSPR